ncbi:hypothetical protein GOP80_06670 [Planococcaceae bacterium Storch 2/2-2]|nr:hypothetical protein [Planococcaceae bacterium Storch 2/2-2]
MRQVEVAGTFKWSEEQLKAYGGAFCGGDAVRSGGKWSKVFQFHGDSDGVWYEVKDEAPCEVVTLKDYKLKGGEKLVWLGKTNDAQTFGKSYKAFHIRVFLQDVGMCFVNDVHRVQFVDGSGEDWGIIPRFDDVKEEMNLFDHIVKELEEMDFRVRVYGHKEEKWRHAFVETNRELQVYGVRDAFLEISEEGSDDEVLVRLGGYKAGEEVAIEEKSYRSMHWTINRVLTTFDKYGGLNSGQGVIELASSGDFE